MTNSESEFAHYPHMDDPEVRELIDPINKIEAGLAQDTIWEVINRAMGRLPEDKTEE